MGHDFLNWTFPLTNSALLLQILIICVQMLVHNILLAIMCTENV